MSDLAIPACASCGHAIWPPRLACAVCGAAEWTEVPAPTGTLEDVTEVTGDDGKPTRLGTVRPAVPAAGPSGQGNSRRAGAGPPLIAAVAGDARPGDEVRLRLVAGALLAEK